MTRLPYKDWHGIVYYWTIDALLSPTTYLAQQRYFFGRRFHSDLMLPSQVINPRISNQREMIAKKEGKFHPISTTSNNAFGFKTQHPRNGIQDPSRRRPQNQTPIGWNSTVQNTEEIQTLLSLDKHKMSTLRLELQQKCISQPLKPVPVAQPQPKQVQWMPFTQNTHRSLPQVMGRPLPQYQRNIMMPLPEFLPEATKE